MIHKRRRKVTLVRTEANFGAQQNMKWCAAKHQTVRTITICSAHVLFNIIVCFYEYHTMLLKYHSNFFGKTYYVIYDKLLCFILEVSNLIIETLYIHIIIVRRKRVQIRHNTAALISSAAIKVG